MQIITVTFVQRCNVNRGILQILAEIHSIDI